jgi:hypothetical protein
MSPHLSVDSQRAALAEMARHRGGLPNLVVPTGIGSISILSDMTTLDDAVLERANRLLDATEVCQ